MKNLTLILTTFLTFNAFSQIYVDSVSLEQFYYDSSDVNNQLWQIGQTTKPFFDNAWVLVTDTTTMYDSLSNASVDLLLTRTLSSIGFHSFFLSFDHKMDSDTNHAGGYLLFNVDNDSLYYDYGGNTYSTWWLRINLSPETETYSSTWDTYMITDQGHEILMQSNNPNSIYSSSMGAGLDCWIDTNGYCDSLFNNEIGFTGTYNEWKYVQMELLFAEPVKSQDEQDTLNVRFRFVSDSTSSGKNGWALKNIQSGYILHTGEMDDFGIDDKIILAYPNPTNGKVKAIIPNSSNSFVEIQLCDVNGRVLEKILVNGEAMEIDLTKYPEGLYFLKYFINEQEYHSRIIRN